MDDRDQGAGGFPGDWLEQQRRFWTGWAQGAGDAGLGGAEAAWAAACEGWWREMAEAVPAPLAGPLKAALEQTRLCLRLLDGGARGDAVEPPVDPGVFFAAALEALERPTDAPPPDGAEADYLRAFQAYMDALAEIAGGGLKRVRARLDDERPTEPAAVYAVYAQEVEAHYREAAAGEKFARTVGELVNARMRLLASRREAGA